MQATRYPKLCWVWLVVWQIVLRLAEGYAGGWGHGGAAQVSLKVGPHSCRPEDQHTSQLNFILASQDVGSQALEACCLGL
eukprot:3246245-Amphidinium_carterae.1